MGGGFADVDGVGLSEGADRLGAGEGESEVEEEKEEEERVSVRPLRPRPTRSRHGQADALMHETGYVVRFATAIAWLISFAVHHCGSTTSVVPLSLFISRPRPPLALFVAWCPYQFPHAVEGRVARGDDCAAAPPRPAHVGRDWHL